MTRMVDPPPSSVSILLLFTSSRVSTNFTEYLSRRPSKVPLDLFDRPGPVLPVRTVHRHTHYRSSELWSFGQGIPSSKETVTDREG